MKIVLTFSLLALLFTYLESIGRMKNGMKIGFILVTILGCIHYNYGNDYMSYYEIGETVARTPFNLGLIMSGAIHRDPGWILLNYLFKPFGGFFVMVIALNILQNVIVYKFISKQVANEWRWLAVLIYLFTPQFYLYNFSMMRQGLVVCVFLGILPLIRNKKWIWSLIILFACSLIHKSSLILVPFSFFGFLPMDDAPSRRLGVSFLLIYLLMLIFPQIAEAIFTFLTSGDEFSGYVEQYSKNTDTGHYGIGFLLAQIPVVLSFLYWFKNEDDREKRLIVGLSMLGIIITPLTSFVRMAGRIGFYFGIYKLASIPLVFSTVKNKSLLTVLTGLYCLLTLYSTYIFFFVDGWKEHYTDFHTIFEAL